MQHVTVKKSTTNAHCARCGRVYGVEEGKLRLKSLHDPKHEAEICPTCHRVEGFENQYDAEGNLLKRGACGDIPATEAKYWITGEDGIGESGAEERDKKDEAKNLVPLACPFCGGAAELVEIHPELPNGDLDTLYRVECVAADCGCRTNDWFPAGAAVRSWNREPK